MSHLFLTGAPTTPSGAPAALSGPSPALSEGPASGSIDRARDGGQEPPRLALPCAAPDRPQLISFLTMHIEALETGLRALDASLPCEGCGAIDLLAVDSHHRLAVVDVDTGADDTLLLRGLAHFDWVTRNVPNLRRMYRTEAVDFSLRPRVFLVAPRLSWMVRCAARQIIAPRIVWCTYRAVALPGVVGIVIDAARADA